VCINYYPKNTAVPKGIEIKKIGKKMPHNKEKRRMSSSDQCSVEETHTTRASEKSDEIIANDDDENPKPTAVWRLFREASLKGGACRDIVETHVICKLRDGSQILLRGEHGNEKVD
jgi:hypothetical protein